ncbi:TIGR03084 family metal-binding protein [Yinghuangia seranimata]|uniref:TIGR03084 family metal-binding protein n=1 Tax=Yinghuangia seranimata TaxID=408067 RepID=UPI00248C8DC0|nr:TIGR03084 family metal-binding protein [Yinghuangia seranimata]MDI2130024.1 TIGR03084 family metal-binding protein [Yinghuangia seranimata]
MTDLADLLADLAAEGAALDALVAGLPDDDWARPTPAVPWTIAHQIAHLAWTDAQAERAAVDPDGFAAEAKRFHELGSRFVDEAAEAGASEPPRDLLARWRAARSGLAVALAALPDGVKMPWFGPPMKPTTMATSRLMETWAHGQDVADALGVRRKPTSRLKAVAFLGVRTFGYAFTVRGLDAPAVGLRAELRAPDGSLWVLGPDDTDQVVRGSAEDFCLLVTRRRHPDDLDLTAQGSVAAEWLTLAQAFAGPPGEDRRPDGP